MGKRLPAAALLSCASTLRAAAAAAATAATVKPAKPPPISLATSKDTSAAAGASSGGFRRPEAPAAAEEEERVPLADVVSDCARRWFQDALKEARAGDAAMQVLVGQMYRSGYGVPKNEQKARVWIEKASRYRSSVWKVSNKRPGYNASDSDSDDANESVK